MMKANTIKSALFGLAVGDALGVPVEFKNRLFLRQNPVMGMQGHGTYNQLPGTWSDDSSLAFCTAEALCDTYALTNIADHFIRWMTESHWAARGEVFDIGGTTKTALYRYLNEGDPLSCGCFDSRSNGNGSLMRILPLVFLIKNKPIEAQFDICKDVSSLTHGHIRSVIACFYYLVFAAKLMDGSDKHSALTDTNREVEEYLNALAIDEEEMQFFQRIFHRNIPGLNEDDIKSDGYVVHTLEASIWCLMTTDNYKDAVLRAVNLGGDTDTTASVVGGLAGLIYGYSAIPAEWIDVLARKDDINELSYRLAEKLSDNQ